MEQKPKNVSPMSNEGRNAYVIGQLTDALLSLPEEKPLEGISVSELCDGAGVGRTSFYRNYGEKEDIIKAHIKCLFQDWAGKCKGAPDLPVSETIRSPGRSTPNSAVVIAWVPDTKLCRISASSAPKISATTASSVSRPRSPYP